MKKVMIILALVTVTGMSCKKNGGQCYECSYGIINGYQRPNDEYCGDINTYKPKDAQGNEWQFYCVPK